VDLSLTSTAEPSFSRSQSRPPIDFATRAAPAGYPQQQQQQGYTPQGYPQQGYPPQQGSPQPGQPQMNVYVQQAPGYQAQPPAGYYQGAPMQAQQVIVVEQQVVFGRAPVACVCPACRANIVTNVDYTPGAMAWLSCLGMAILGAWPWCVWSGRGGRARRRCVRGGRCGRAAMLVAAPSVRARGHCRGCAASGNGGSRVMSAADSFFCASFRASLAAA